MATEEAGEEPADSSPANNAETPAEKTPRERRRDLISELQEARGGRLIIAYITSTRSGHEIAIADDVLRLLYEHLDVGRKAAEKGVDLFIHSNGGSGTVPWRVVSIIREFTKNFAVLVPHRAFSAATLIALGADEILMHKMGCLGPIDPSVANVFNPVHPQSPGQLAHISVEDVSAYFKLVKDSVGINHEDELIQAFRAMTDKVHPLALGNVQRHHHQSRLMARKLLKKHMQSDRDHEIDQIIDNLKSNLFFHGHPISRSEAINDLKLKVKNPPDDVENLMWSLYVEYEESLKMAEPFNPLHELDVRSPKTPPGGQQLTTQDIVQQMGQLAAAGLGLGNLNEEQLVKMAVAMLPYVNQTTTKQETKVRLDGIPGAYVQSIDRSDVFLSDLCLERFQMNTPAGPQDAMKQEALWQRWELEE